MLRIIVSPRAREDIVGIAAFTLEMWGEEQMSRYVDGLHERFTALARSPGMGRRREELGPGYRSLVQGSHIVFYKTDSRKLTVVRVLHVRMSPERHIRQAKE